MKIKARNVRNERPPLENVLVGAGATVIEYKSIADNVIIGAGSVVVEDIPESGTYFGNPARLRRG